MLTLLASHPPHPSPAQRRDSGIIHFNAKIKPAASNLSLHPFGLNTEQCAGLSVCPCCICWCIQIVLLVQDRKEKKNLSPSHLKHMHTHVKNVLMHLCAVYILITGVHACLSSSQLRKRVLTLTERAHARHKFKFLSSEAQHATGVVC